jgi:hypothetical protein
MFMSAYRINNSITAVIRRGARERFKCLDGGSILFPISGPNAARMIEARYENDIVLVFERDLDEATEQIEIEVVGASPQNSIRDCCPATPNPTASRKSISPPEA